MKQMFFWNSLDFSMSHQMLAIWSLVLLPFLNPACTSGSSRFMYCWSLAWRILSIILLACESESCLVVSNSLWPHGLYIPWNSPGQNTGVGSLSLQRTFPTQWLNWGLLLYRQILYQLSHKGSPISMWDMCNCAIIAAFFGIACLWNWYENWPLPVNLSIHNYCNLW